MQGGEAAENFRRGEICTATTMLPLPETHRPQAIHYPGHCALVAPSPGELARGKAASPERERPTQSPQREQNGAAAVYGPRT